MKYALPTTLRQPDQRYAPLKVADALLRADRKRRRRMEFNDSRGGGTAPAPIKKQDGGPFAVLAQHPQYRAPRNGASRRP
jgi:hypothetical protein